MATATATKLLTAEELVILIVKPGDTFGRLMRRVVQFLRFGVTSVWVVDPEARDVIVHRAGKEPHVFGAKDELTCADVLPDFHCRVADFFEMSEKASPARKSRRGRR